MKKTTKGFTLVELIIVIAVIGVLAAILIPVFSNVIEKANIKSAFSDAKNALSLYLADKTSGEGGAVVEEGTVFVVTKNEVPYYFTYVDNGLREGDGTDGASALDKPSTMADTPIDTSDVDEFPDHIEMFLEAPPSYAPVVPD